MDRKLYKYKINIYLMYGYWFFHNLIFAYVIERLYWASRGMSNQEVVYTEIIYAVVVLILEVPTGTLADRWSKKMLMIVNSLLVIVEFIVLIQACSFWHFALAVSISGVGKALASGTSNALVYDSLKMIDREKSFEKISGRIGFFDYAASMLAALIGSYVAYKNGYVSTYWLSLISVIICFMITLFLTEPESISEEEKTQSYTECIKESYIFLKGQPSVRFVLLFGIVISSIFVYIDEFWQIYLSEIKIPVLLFGVISSARMLSASLSGIYAYKLKDRFSYKKIFSWLIIIFIASIFGASLIKSYLGLIPLIICFIAYGIVEPLSLGYLHHRTESRIRATVESFQSLVLRASTIVCGLLFGYFSTKYDIFAGFILLGSVLAIYSIYYFSNKDKYI
jgi:MFS family permease